jgi:thiamine biosynthesis lipoprotein
MITTLAPYQRCLFFGLFLLAFTGHTQAQLSIKPFHIAGYAQGTTYHITYYALDSIVAQRQTDSILNGIDSSLSIYKPYSLISRFNNSTRGLRMDRMLRTVVERSLEIYKETSGISDITVAPLVEAWGFGIKSIEDIPSSDAIARLMPCIGSDKLEVRGDSLIKTTPCVRIDVNGIAQGYSVDIVADFLERMHIADYLVEIGGEIRVKGRHGTSGRKMSIGIESPSDDGFNQLPIRKVILLDHGAVTTSGNYRKYYEAGGKKISHLIDPKTGYPFQNEMISVTVLAKDAITADGYDNALMGMGLKKAMKFVAGKKDMDAYFIYHKPDGAVADTASAGFYKHLNSASTP